MSRGFYSEQALIQSAFLLFWFCHTLTTHPGVGVHLFRTDSSCLVSFALSLRHCVIIVFRYLVILCILIQVFPWTGSYINFGSFSRNFDILLVRFLNWVFQVMSVY